MIPPFDENGYLPPGIHSATLDEIEARFGLESELRKAQMQSLRWLVELAHRAGVRRLVVNGSFVTHELEPNDVDCALLIGDDFPPSEDVEEELSNGLPFVELQLLEQEDFDALVNRFFATDRREAPKGMLEVVPWT